MNSSKNSRKESDRHIPKNTLMSLISRPEIGPIGVMILLFGMLGYFSIPASETTWNPFAGEGFNALGIRNNLRVISQLGIIALGAGLLIIAGEFDLSIGSMIGFAGACMAMTLRWGFSIVLPYISFDGGAHLEFYTLLHIPDVSPILAIFITLCFTITFGWIQGFIIVRSGLPSFIVTLGGLFFLRGLTEVSLRSFNHRPDQAKGATTVTEIPDIKNIINLPGYGEMEREAAKYLPETDLISILKNLPVEVITKITEKLEYTSQRVAEAKTDLLITKGVKPLERALENAIASDNELLGLKLGADDFIKKSGGFSIKVLIERIRVQLRKKNTSTEDSKNLIVHGKLKLDPNQLECEWNGKALPEKLTTTEFLIVKELAKRPGVIKERAHLMDIAYKENTDIEDRTIDSHIKRIRKKFKKVDDRFSSIETRYGSGYRWNIN